MQHHSKKTLLWQSAALALLGGPTRRYPPQTQCKLQKRNTPPSQNQRPNATSKRAWCRTEGKALYGFSPTPPAKSPPITRRHEAPDNGDFPRCTAHSCANVCGAVGRISERQVCDRPPTFFTFFSRLNQNRSPVSAVGHCPKPGFSKVQDIKKPTSHPNYY